MKMSVKKIQALIFAALIIASPCSAAIKSYAADISTSKIVDNVSPQKISINFVNTDVRDALSAIALNMGLNIIYMGSQQNITLEIDNVSPWTAFDYALKMLNLTYIKKDNSLIVGEKDMLNQNFADTLSLTRFTLDYINSSMIIDKINQLNIPVTVISMETNDKAIWVQGYPYDFAKVNELIMLLDIEDNMVGVTNQSGNTKRLLSMQLKYLSPDEFNSILKAIGVNVAITLADENDKLYLYATSEEYNMVNDIKTKLDRNDSYTILANSSAEQTNGNKFEILSVKYANKKDVIELIQAMCTGVKIISPNNAISKSFMIIGDANEVNKAKSILSQLDKTNYQFKLNETYSSYILKNLTAAEANRRLSQIEFEEEVKFYVSPNADIDKTIFIYTTEGYMEEVKRLIEKIDSETGEMFTVPIYSSQDSAVANSIFNTLNAFLPTEFSAKLNMSQYGNMYYIYLVNADYAVMSLVESLLSRIPEASNGVNASDLTWEKYLEYCKANNLTGTEVGYVAWVQAKINGSTTFSLLSEDYVNNNIDNDFSVNHNAQNNENVGNNSIERAYYAVVDWFKTYKPNTNQSRDDIYTNVIDEATYAINATSSVTSADKERLILTGEIESYTEPNTTTAGVIKIRITFKDKQNVFEALSKVYSYVVPKIKDTSSSVVDNSSSNLNSSDDSSSTLNDESSNDNSSSKVEDNSSSSQDSSSSKNDNSSSSNESSSKQGE